MSFNIKPSALVDGKMKILKHKMMPIAIRLKFIFNIIESTINQRQHIRQTYCQKIIVAKYDMVLPQKDSQISRKVINRIV